MILLEDGNVLITDFLTEKFSKPSSTDQAFVDFDGVRYHLSTPTSKSVLELFIYLPGWDELVQYGVEDILRREYGSYLIEAHSGQVEQGYNVGLRFEVDKVPPEGEERTTLIRSASLLKRNAMSAPFERAFAIQRHLETNPPGPDTLPQVQEIMSLHYRPEEAIYIQPSADRVTVVFSTVFKEDTDRVLGRVFLQEFVDARKSHAIQGAPQVLYSNREPPLEIRHLPGLSNAEDMGYVTFVLFPRHFSNPTVAYTTVSQIQLFRDYLHYHIKCSKAYLHSRMRFRVGEFLKILNRAKMETAGTGERKTASGRTFVRS